MGPAGLLTKVDRLLTGLDFLHLTQTSANDASRNADIETAQKRMGMWKVNIRKEKKRDTAAYLDDEREECDLEELTAIIRDERLLSDFEPDPKEKAPPHS